MQARPIERRFPEVARHLEAALSKVVITQGSRRRAFISIAKHLGISIDAIDSWCRGVRCIPEEKIDPLVRVLGHETASGDLTSDGLALIEALKTARRNNQSLLSWKERVDQSKIKIRVQQARYLGTGKLWGRIFFPFLDAADVRHEADPPTRNFFDLQHTVWCGGLDVALGILATPRLGLKLWFFNSPIHYRLNCITLAGADMIRGVAGIRDALARPKARQRLFAPIVMKGEVGEAYALNNLGLVDPILVSSLSATEFSASLLNNERRADGRMPLIIVDEITCLSILLKLRTRGKLVFPLVPDREDHRTLIPPSFPLGLCVSRNERVGHAKKSELMGFIKDALPTYIGGNAHSIAFFYVALCNQMRRLVDRAMPASPSAEREEWTVRAFRLSNELSTLEPPHWRAVLREAMAIRSSYKSSASVDMWPRWTFSESAREEQPDT